MADQRPSYVADLRDRVRALEDQRDSLRERVSALEADLGGVLGQRDLLSQKCYEHTQEVVRLSAECEAMRAVVDAAVARVVAINDGPMNRTEAVATFAALTEAVDEYRRHMAEKGK